MRTYLSGLTASGYAHPKIIPGAIYLDKNGNRVTYNHLVTFYLLLPRWKGQLLRIRPGRNWFTNY